MIGEQIEIREMRGCMAHVVHSAKKARILCVGLKKYAGSSRRYKSYLIKEKKKPAYWIPAFDVVRHEDGVLRQEK